jgi:hypothetical protein
LAFLEGVNLFREAAMARTVAEIPGGARVTDFITLGVLTERIPVEQVERVLEETDRQSERQRKLPMRVMVYYVIALALYMQVSYGEVLRCLLEGLEWLGLPVKSIRTVQMSSISRARMRLGVEPLKRLYEELVVPVASAKTRGAWYRGRKLVTIDGSTLDVADTRENEQAFGRPGASRGTAGFPKIRLVSLVENGTHVLFGARHGPYKGSSEKALAAEALKRLTGGMLCLADRNFFSFKLWEQSIGTGADQLWRIPEPNVLPCIKRLKDGSYLSKVYPSPKHRKRDRDGIVVRVIEYQLEGVGKSEGGSEVYRLITTLLDPTEAPAEELAALYHERWEIENAFDELKTHLRGNAIVLRSKTPELVAQELYGLLLAHSAVRGLMHEAAVGADIDPDTVSFVHAVRVIRRKLPRYVAFPPSGRSDGAPSGDLGGNP